MVLRMCFPPSKFEVFISLGLEMFDSNGLIVGRRQAKQRSWRKNTKHSCSKYGDTFAKLYMLCCWLHTLWMAGDLDAKADCKATVLPVVRHNISIAFEGNAFATKCLIHLKQ